MSTNRIKEFIEPDLVNLSQGLVSVSTATTYDTSKLEEVYKRNAEKIEKYRLPPKENSVAKVFTISWQGHPCGQIVIQLDNSTNSGLLSYWVDSQLSNRNIATNAVILIKEYAFDVLNLNYLEAYVQPENAKSIRVLEKSDFTKTESLYKPNSPANSSVLHLIYKTYP